MPNTFIGTTEKKRCFSNERLHEYLGEGRRETERRTVSVDGGETEGKRKS